MCVEVTAHIRRLEREDEILDVENARRVVGPFDEIAELAEIVVPVTGIVPRASRRERTWTAASPIKEDRQAVGCQIARLPPRQVQFPRRDLMLSQNIACECGADGAAIVARRADDRAVAARVAFVEDQEVHHLLAVMSRLFLAVGLFAGGAEKG